MFLLLIKLNIYFVNTCIMVSMTNRHSSVTDEGEERVSKLSLYHYLNSMLMLTSATVSQLGKGVIKIKVISECISKN